MPRRTNLFNIVQNPDEWIAILEPGHHVSSIDSSNQGSILTLGAPETRDTCISSSLRLSGSSGRGSAAARIRLPQKSMRFARKPLIKTHWSATVGGFCFPYNNKKKNQRMPSKNISPGNEPGRNDCCDVLHVPERCTKKNWQQPCLRFCSPKRSPRHRKCCPQMLRQPKR